MITHPLTVSPDTLLNSAIAQMSQEQTSCVLVVEGQSLVGIFTERDLVRLIASGAITEGVTIDAVMTPQAIALRESQVQDLFYILNLFREHRIRHLPIVDDSGELVGLITPHSLRQVLNSSDLLRLRRVEEVMETQVVHAPENVSVLKLVELMAQESVSCILITRENSNKIIQPQGIVTERDIVQFQTLGMDFNQTQAQTVMSTPLLPIQPQNSLWIAHEQMKRHHVRHLVVCGQQGELAGVITQSSILQALEPAEIYSVVQILQQEVRKLEEEKVELLHERNRQLEKQVEDSIATIHRTAERERLLATIALRIRQSLNLEEILNTTVAEVRQLLQTDRVIIYRFNPDWSGIVVVESVSNPDWSILGRTITDPCFGQFWVNPYTEGRIQATADIYTSGLSQCYVELLAQLQIRANLIVPILLAEEAEQKRTSPSQKSQNRLWGLLVAHNCCTPRQWQASEIDFLCSLATHVAIAIQQATLVEQLHTELAQQKQTQKELQDNITARKQAQAALEYQIEFDRLVANISTRFINLTSDQIASGIQQALREIGEFTQVDTSYVFLFSQDRTTLTMTHEWVSQGLEPQIQNCQNLSGAAFPWANTKLQRGEILYVPSLANLPAEAAIDRANWQTFNLQSIICVPLSYQGTVIGWIGFASFHQEKTWSESSINLLKIVGEVFTNALQSQRTEKALREHQERYTLAVQGSRDGLWDWNILTNEVYYTPRFKEILGYEDHEMANDFHAFESRLHPEDRDRILKVVQNHIEHRVPYDVEYRLRAKTGDYRWIHARAQGIWDEQGNATRMAGSISDISDRKQAQKALQESHTKISLITDNLPAWIAYVDKEQRYRFVNKQYERAFRIPSQDILGKSPQDILGANYEEVREYLERALTGEQVSFEHIIHLGDGIKRYVSTQYIPHIEEGKVLGFFGLIVDITERKQAQEILRLSEERLQLALEGSGDGLWDWNITTGEIYFSPRWLEMLGYDLDELPGHFSTWEKLIHPEDKPWVMEVLNAHLKDTSVPYAFDYRVLTKSGQWKWIANYGKVVGSDRKGKPLRMAGTHKDISDRKQTEEALRQSEEKFRQLAENIRQVFFIQSPDYSETIYISPAYEEIWECSCQSLYNDPQSWQESIHPDDREFVRATIEKQFAQDEPFRGEYRILKPDGTVVWIFARTFLLRDDTGEIHRVVGIAEDITERKQAEAALKQAKAELKIKVAQRTAQLVKANEQLQHQLLQRQRAEDKLRKSEQQYRTLVRNFPNGAVFLFDRDLRYIIADGIALRENDFQSELLKGKTLWEVLPRESCAHLEPCYRAALADQTTTIETTYRGRTFFSQVLPVKNEQGEIFAGMVVSQDITERKQAEEALRESEAKNRAILNAIPDLMFRISSDGIFLDFKAVKDEELFVPSSKFLGKKVPEVMPAQTAQQTMYYVEQALKTGEIQIFEYPLPMRSGIRNYEARIVVSGENEVLGIVRDITESKRIQQQLRQTQNRLQFLLAASPAVIYSAKATGDYGTIFISENVTSQLGYQAREFLHNPEFWAEHIHPEDAPHILPELPNLVKQENYTLEYRFQQRDGTYRWLHDEGRLVRSAEGPRLELVGYLVDITDRKRAEAERDKLIAIVEATSDFVGSAGVDEQIQYLNDAARKLFGLTENEDLTSFAISDAYPNWAYKIIQNEAIPVAMRDGVWLGETAFLSCDGKEIPVSQLLIAHKSPDGSVKLLSTIARDISQQKQIEATLRESERRWRTLLENVRLVVVGLDQNGKVEYVNPFFLELTGYTETEILGKDWFETLLPQCQKQQVQKYFLEILEQDLKAHYQNSILTKSGEERIIAWNNTLLQNSQRETIGTMSIGEDITESYAIERMKDEFISVVSHELRTPLTSIHGALKLLSSGLVASQSERGRRVLEIAAENSERLVLLVNDILELERLESGKIKLSKQQVNAADLFRRVIELMQVMANRAEINLEVSAQDIQCYADGDRIIQVLTNLLSNAIKFSPRGSTIWLTAELEKENKFSQSPLTNSQYPIPTILFKVQDQGRGIPADKIESIFERFHQVDASDSRKKGGTGLGLAICRNIVEQHGGQIWVESTLDEGSSFYFTLPAHLC
ncbi:MAG: PAS domain S-box protein [Xenococcaceae cyanobacterium]